MYKKLLLITVFLGLTSCSHRKNFIPFGEDRLYLKEVGLKKDTIEWFFY